MGIGSDTIYTRRLEEKLYELTDHLGNVRGVISDRMLSDIVAGVPGKYRAEMRRYSNLYPYGMEQDSSSTGDHYTTYFRQYDARLGRFWSMDPVTHEWESPYAAMGGNPIALADPSGADPEDPETGGGESQGEAGDDAGFDSGRGTSNSPLKGKSVTGRPDGGGLAGPLHEEIYFGPPSPKGGEGGIASGVQWFGDYVIGIGTSLVDAAEGVGQTIGSVWQALNGVSEYLGKSGEVLGREGFGAFWEMQTRQAIADMNGAQQRYAQLSAKVDATLSMPAEMHLAMLKHDLQQPQFYSSLTANGLMMWASGRMVPVENAASFSLGPPSPRPLLEVGRQAASVEASAFSRLSRAGEFGIKPYNQLRADIKGTGLQAHHLIEKRFAKALEVDENLMASVAVTPAEHQVFTNAWRRLIPYGNGTLEATKALILDAAREIYANYPEILRALGL